MTDPKHGDNSICSATALRKASRRLTMLYDAALAPAGLTVTQYALLTELVRRAEQAPTVTELAEAMVMDRSGLGHTLGPLERDGFIALAVNGKDARSRHVVLTVRGKALQKKAHALWVKAQKQFTDAIGAREVSRLQTALLSIAHDDRLTVS
jgi:DNA-binding MarR family transcriptional regulator